MIPKIIHYCWFGKKEMPELAIKCLETWKQQLPDYEIIRWDETNFDVNQYLFSEQAYKHKKYAFVADVCRLHALKLLGGIYLDTDVEMIKNLDDLLYNTAFTGFETEEILTTGILASEKNSQWINDFLNYYKDRPFVRKDGSLDIEPNPQILTALMKNRGFLLNNTYQKKEGYLTIYKLDFFCPKSFKTGKIKLTKNTYCIHHFSGSWVSKGILIKEFIFKILYSFLGETKVDNIRNWLKKLKSKN